MATIIDKFRLGKIVITAGAAARVTGAEVEACLTRHRTGDWGDICDEDRASNEEQCKLNWGCHSSYKLDGNVTLWIITDPGHEVTTILLPDEY